jgi:murein L,D-transpeptidase YafK
MKMTTLLFLLFLTSSTSNSSILKEQMLVPTVNTAYSNHIDDIDKLLDSFQLDKSKLDLYIQAFKSEKTLHVWAKNNSDSLYELIKTLPICKNSGTLGPKRQEGDRQVPEGHYYINIFNPYSHYHLSLGINYPNKSDSILGIQGKLGNDIYIHGKCVTWGCLPLGDNNIEYFYILCLLAREAGQAWIPITIYPVRMTDTYYKNLLIAYPKDTDNKALWADLKQLYQEFEDSKKLPKVGIDDKGGYKIGK